LEKRKANEKGRNSDHVKPLQVLLVYTIMPALAKCRSAERTHLVFK
jgi:hypothetical protein